MNITFQDKELEQFVSDKRKAGNKFKKYAKDDNFYQKLVRAFQILYAVSSTNELRAFSFLHHEQLKHKNISSIRIANNYVERLIFNEIENGIEIIILELNNTHYGNKK